RILKRDPGFRKGIGIFRLTPTPLQRARGAMKTQQVIKYISGWLQKYCEESGMNGFVVGVSGGIDSALTSTLCALTGKQVVVLNMPIHQHKNQYSLAAEHIAWLEKKFKNVSGHEVKLTGAFKRLFET